MRRTTILGLTVAMLLAGAPAVAQDAQPTVADAYLGITGGYHDLGVDAPGDEGGAIGGVVAGFDVPVSGGVTLGLEGNFNLGTGAIDSEYGVAARLGYKFPSGGLAYVRGGYQWVNVDVGKLIGADFEDDDLGFSDVAKDYLVGVGGEFPLRGSKIKLRVGVDTIAFDSIRPTAGLILNF